MWVRGGGCGHGNLRCPSTPKACEAACPGRSEKHKRPKKKTLNYSVREKSSSSAHRRRGWYMCVRGRALHGPRLATCVCPHGALVAKKCRSQTHSADGLQFP